MMGGEQKGWDSRSRTEKRCCHWKQLPSVLSTLCLGVQHCPLPKRYEEGREAHLCDLLEMPKSLHKGGFSAHHKHPL